LREVFWIAITAYGGPQGHLALFFDFFVKKRGYLKEEELLELNALCQILPGPTSTQTITAVGYKIGGAKLAYLTLLLWILPAVTIMTCAALGITYLHSHQISDDFTRFIQPMAVGIIAYASYNISKKVVNGKVSFLLMLLSAVSAYLISTFSGNTHLATFFYPIVILLAGFVTATLYRKKHKKEEKQKLVIHWSNLVLFIVIFLLAVAFGNLMSNKVILLFENFYRNGSLVFGGGQVLVPLLNTEFVEYKHYLTASEFRTGYGFVQAIPGPVFSFTSYIGCLSMREGGLSAQLWGSIVSSLGIFLPGTFLIFFVIRFWEQLKKYRIIKASIEGISAASAGLIAAVAVMLFQSLEIDFHSTLGLFEAFLVIATFFILLFTKLRSPLLIVIGLLMGVIWQFYFLP